VQHHEQRGGKVGTQSSDEPGKSVDPAGRRSDGDNISPGQCRLPSGGRSDRSASLSTS
jgi:hypothetical protein